MENWRKDLGTLEEVEAEAGKPLKISKTLYLSEQRTEGSMDRISIPNLISPVLDIQRPALLSREDCMVNLI